MAQILLLALAGAALPTFVRLALAFVRLLAKLVAAGIVVGAALYLTLTLIAHVL
jgi:hypothetical protein